MKILKKLIEKANDTLEEIEWYAEKAIALKEEHRALADVYVRIADMHITIYNMLHEKMVSLINEEKSRGVKPPEAMVTLWEYEHEKATKEFLEAKYLLEEYKRMG